MLTYIDSSVALAHLFAEARQPRPDIWDRRLISSRLLEYEIWTRVHGRVGTAAMSEAARTLLSGVELLEMSRETLARALSPFPVHVRTLDGLHLATAEYLRQQGESVELASYDGRLIAAARAIEIPVAAL